jgi:hypothetical protein
MYVKVSSTPSRQLVLRALVDAILLRDILERARSVDSLPAVIAEILHDVSNRVPPVPKFEDA